MVGVMYAPWFSRALEGFRSQLLTSSIVAAMALAEEAWARESEPAAASKVADAPRVSPPAGIEKPIARPVLTLAAWTMAPAASSGPAPLLFLDAPSPHVGAPLQQEPRAFTLRGAELSLRRLELVGTANARPRLSLFVGNSTASLGGLRIRF